MGSSQKEELRYRYQEAIIAMEFVRIARSRGHAPSDGVAVAAQQGPNLLAMRNAIGSDMIRDVLAKLDEADRMFDASESEQPVPPPPPAVDEALVEKLARSVYFIREISKRGRGCLTMVGGTPHLVDVVQKTEEDILPRLKNGRPKILREVKEVLATLGLSLGMELDDATIAAVRAKIAEREGGGAR